MKKLNSKLLLSLLACTLMASCTSDGTKVENGSKPVGVVTADGTNLNTLLEVQKFYTDLKTSSGGSEVAAKVLEKIINIEYSEENLATIAATKDKFDVREYHTSETLKTDITKKFQDVIDGNSYNDDDGVFDPEKYKDYIEKTYDLKLEKGTTNAKYVGDTELAAKLKYNYDEYVEKTLKVDILKEYVYLDYVASASKYTGQISSQNVAKVEVLKIPSEDNKLNALWTPSLLRDVRKVTRADKEAKFATDYGFATFNSNNQLVVFETKEEALTYTVYDVNEAELKKYVPALQKSTKKEEIIKLMSLEQAKTITGTKVEASSWTIAKDATANGEFYQHINDVLVARKLWVMDNEVVIAQNYDARNNRFDSMTKSERDEAKTFLDTYTATNTKAIEKVVKEKKISIQHEKFYSKPEYYTKSSLSNVLPSTLVSERGTSAKDLVSHTKVFGDDATENRFLVKGNNIETLDNPVYYDTSSKNYYVCEVKDWYGLYKSSSDNLYDTAANYKTVTNYQVDAYQAGKFSEWNYSEADKTWKSENEKVYSSETVADFTNIVEIVKTAVNGVLTDSIKKEAVVALFTKYGLEANDQEIYDYLKGQYPDYFKSE